jgi:hypothetical protein
MTDATKPLPYPAYLVLDMSDGEITRERADKLARGCGVIPEDLIDVVVDIVIAVRAESDA